MVPDLMLYITHILTEFHKLPGHLWRKEWNSMRYSWCPHAALLDWAGYTIELYLLIDCSVLMTCVVEATTVVKWDRSKSRYNVYFIACFVYNPLAHLFLVTGLRETEAVIHILQRRLRFKEISSARNGHARQSLWAPSPGPFAVPDFCFLTVY